MLVEEIGRLDELRLRVRLIGVQDPVLHVAFGSDDDQQHAALRQPQELDVTEPRLPALRRHDDSGEMGELREQRAGGVHQLLRPIGRQLALEPMDLALPSGRMTMRLSTKNRYPFDVGTRPADVCGLAM